MKPLQDFMIWHPLVCQVCGMAFCAASFCIVQCAVYVCAVHVSVCGYRGGEPLVDTTPLVPTSAPLALAVLSALRCRNRRARAPARRGSAPCTCCGSRRR